jgi:hypothetical protein
LLVRKNSRALNDEIGNQLIIAKTTNKQPIKGKGRKM